MQQTKRQPDKAARATTEDYVPDANLAARIAALGSLAESVEAVVTALEQGRGTYTPAEDFIESICLLYSSGKLTPERVEEHLEDFRANLEATTDVVRHLCPAEPCRVPGPVPGNRVPGGHRKPWRA
jgi:hypothetical protein